MWRPQCQSHFWRLDDRNFRCSGHSVVGLRQHANVAAVEHHLGSSGDGLSIDNNCRPAQCCVVCCLHCITSGKGGIRGPVAHAELKQMVYTMCRGSGVCHKGQNTEPLRPQFMQSIDAMKRMIPRAMQGLLTTLSLPVRHACRECSSRDRDPQLPEILLKSKALISTEAMRAYCKPTCIPILESGA